MSQKKLNSRVTLSEKDYFLVFYGFTSVEDFIREAMPQINYDASKYWVSRTYARI